MLEKIGLKLPEKRLEDEFVESHRKMATPYLIASISIYVVVATFVLTGTSPSRIPAACVTIALWVGSIIVVKKFRKFFDLYILVSIGILIPWFLNIRRKIYLDQDSASNAFLRGYGYGMSFCLNQQGFTKLWELVALEVIYIVARITSLGEVKTPSLVIVILFELAAFIFRVNSEIVARKNFFQLHSSREALVKFKDLVTKLPTSLLIFSRDMKECLFANSKFSEDFPNADKESALNILLNIKMEEENSPLSSTREDDDLVSTIHQCLAFQQDDSFTMRHNFRYAEGEIKYQFEVHAFSFVWDGKKAIAILLNNITHQQDILTLKIANQNKEMAISTVSHELRNPVNGLLGMAQIMEKQTQDPALLKTIHLFKTNINLLLSIINCILDFQQIQANKLRLNIKPVNLEEIFQTVKSLFEFQCEQKSLAFSIELSGKIPKEIRTDKERLSQVLINLCANALKFTFRGKISIFVRPDEDDSRRIKIGVSDTGIGIKPEDKNKLFTMFGKIESSGHLNPHGVGLGLLISSCLVKVLNKNEPGYQIQVDSEQGKGSTFWFSLPKDYDEDLLEERELDSSCSEKIHKVADEGLDEEIQEFEVMNPLKKLKSALNLRSLESKSSLMHIQATIEKRVEKRKVIMIVDDNSFNLLVAQKILEDKGFSTILSYNGKEAVDLIEKLNSEGITPAMILMDLEMPIMDGIEATKILKDRMELKLLEETPIIGLSANDNDATTKACLEAGMSKYCRKPLAEKDLMSLLREYHLLSESYL